ncbi:hypothetical protein FZ934_23475 (plasmid) [Rhizobium grahamii]|uniref:Uncharacterized protein n=1 Tax=Rhizobium grahamii TaxID=1120045 RepID=A0A5Q0CI17_9HYPH|nr:MULTISPECIES: hypothetical protein [Rhizobium]QFY64089.1 hypothetical protein FZ934_23475 [Rhizobium grahamii]QRM53042.1 hypothetical protein F3Y33_22175 [Rhizobium sp. BG6]
MAIVFAVLAVGAAGCTTSSAEIRPLPGSLTYNGRVIHSPYRPGTVVKYTFLGKFGYRVSERYVVQPDGTLKLTYQNVGQDYYIE